MQRLPHLATAVLLAASFTAVARSGGASVSRVHLLRSDDREIVVRVHFPPPQIQKVLVADGWEDDLTIPGLSRTRSLDQPSLPFKSVLVALPPGAEYTLQVGQQAAVTIPLLRPAPYRLPDTAGPVATDPMRSTPPAVVEADMDGYLRQRRVVRLVFHPLTLDESGGSVYHPVVTARLVLSGENLEVFRAASRPLATADAGRPGLPAAGDGFKALYGASILNESLLDDEAYGQALARLQPAHQALRHEVAASINGATSASSGPPPAMMGGGVLPAKIPIRQEKIWSVGYDDLDPASQESGGSPVGNLALMAGGVQVPFRILDTGSDGNFGSGDRIEFYGLGITGNLDHDTNVYRLAFDEGAGTAMTTRNGDPAQGGTSPTSFLHTQRFETNETLFTNDADSDGDRFGWERINNNTVGNCGTPIACFPFNLADLDPAATTITIRARIIDIGGSHTTSISLNSTDLMDDRSWDGPDVTHDTVAATSLLDGTEELTVDLTGSLGNAVNFNWIETDYLRLFIADQDELAFSVNITAPVLHQVSGFTISDIVVYDVTDPAAPVLMTNCQITGMSPDFTVTFTDTVGGVRRFLARAGTALPSGTILPDNPSTLTDTSNEADLIIISHRDFLTDLAPLVTARQAQGLRVELIDVEDAYDEFAFGRPDPTAIRDLVSVAYSTWQQNPAPAFLLLVGNATLDPLQLLSGSVPVMVPTGTFIAPTLGLAATDNFFVTVAGADPLPELHVGRIPAETPTHVSDTVSKTLDYDTVDPDNLNQRFLLVADDDDISFESFQEDIVSLFLSDTRIPPDRAYLRLSTVPATRQQIQDGMNLGTIVANYLGHGNIHNFAAENLFVDSTDIPFLNNSDRPFFLTTMNCINGFHAGPRNSSVSALAEQILMVSGKGAIGVWSPSALGTLTDYRHLSDNLYRLLIQDRVQTLGMATTMAKVEAYVNDGVNIANLEEMTYFGDPTVVLRMDGDRDTLLDVDEDACACGLDPRDGDTDDDGLVDQDETTPSLDSDGDGLFNGEDSDADDDGLPDGLEQGITAASLDTDVTRGIFIPDADPVTTTDHLTADSDGGGAPDGAEDRNADGQINGSETDPNNGADDVVCSVQPLPELDNLDLDTSGTDINLSWDGILGQDPCALYRLLQADMGTTSPGALPALTTRGVYTQNQATLGAEINSPTGHYYLIVATRPGVGDGPTGH